MNSVKSFIYKTKRNLDIYGTYDSMSHKLKIFKEILSPFFFQEKGKNRTSGGRHEP